MQNTRKTLPAGIAMTFVASLLALSAYGRTGAQGKVNPFTYEMVVTQFLDGAVVRSEQVVHAVRKDGSFATITRLHAPNGARYERHEIMDLETLQRSISYSGVNVVTTAPISPEAATRLRADKGKRCGIAKDAETSRIHGYDVIQSSFRSSPATPPEAELEVDKWLAPELGCNPLGMTWRKQGEVVLSHEVKRIETGEPPEILFQRAPRFTEVSPAEAARRLAQGLGVGAFAPLGPMEQEVEDDYFRKRKAAGWD